MHSSLAANLMRSILRIGFPGTFYTFISKNPWIITSPYLPGKCTTSLAVQPETNYYLLNRKTTASIYNRFERYISPVADVFAYALLPNHFHFLVEIKPYTHLCEIYQQKKRISNIANNNSMENGVWQPVFVMQQFSNLLNSYTKSFNEKYNRKGSLFMDYLRRVPIKTTEQFLATVFYIHKNPVHHGLCKKMKDWKWSSYNSILSNTPAKIERQKIIDEFETIEAFIAYHDQPVNLKNAVVVE